MKNIINTLIAATIALSTSNVLAQEYFYRINSKIVVNSNTTTPTPPTTPDTPTTPDPEPAFDCFDPANVGQIGTAGECNGKLIVDNNLLRDLVETNGDYSDMGIFTGQVSDMNALFYSRVVNRIIEGWNTSNVVSMSAMFSGASPMARNTFNQDISGWNVSNVVDMSIMFAFSHFNRNISNWNVYNVLNMDNMFQGAGAFNQNISNWCVISIPLKPNNFDLSANATFRTTPSLQPQWGTCP